MTGRRLWRYAARSNWLAGHPGSYGAARRTPRGSSRWAPRQGPESGSRPHRNRLGPPDSSLRHGSRRTQYCSYSSSRSPSYSLTPVHHLDAARRPRAISVHGQTAPRRIPQHCGVPSRGPTWVGGRRRSAGWHVIITRWTHRPVPPCAQARNRMHATRPQWLSHCRHATPTPVRASGWCRTRPATPSRS
ncbi:Uncharacterised protein [Bifidobacterium longum subsp. infantis]|nr:Uncharacterised protein [Bifidobacterium longum subsp. infantis]